MRGHFRPNLIQDRRGTVLIESLLVLPLLMLITFGVFEYGNLMWQRQQLQVGVRDAARYWSRCRPTFNPCSQTIARNLAFYGDPGGGGSTRVPGWDDSSELTINLASPPLSPDETSVIIVEGKVAYQGSPLFAAVFSESLTLRYWHTERYIGW